MAITTRTRSKVSQNSLSDKEFQDFLNTMITPAKTDDTSSESFTTSFSSSSSYQWSAESPDSVIPGSTSSSSSDVDTSNHVCTDDYVSDNPVSDHHLIQGSSDGNILSLPGLTQSVNTDLKVSISSVLTWFTMLTHIYKKI